MAELRTLARPYAKAAFHAANGASALAAWTEQLNTLGALSAQPKVAELIASPTAKTDTQVDQLCALLGGDVSTPIRNFLSILAENKRLALLEQIAELFAELRSAQEKTVDINISTAFALDESSESKLVAALKQKLEREIVVNTEVDPSLLGGVLVRAGDVVIDGSIKGRLAKLAEAMAV